MAIKFDKIEPGAVLLEVRRQKAGNTTTTRLAVFKVRVISVDRERGTAEVSWNGNRAQTWRRRTLEKLYTKIPPKMAERIAAQRF